MNRKQIIVGCVAVAVLALFVLAMQIYQNSVQANITQQSERLVRPHSPVMGPADARVTIVEFLDPACETCRAFYPIVKDIMRQYPQDVRLVIRYAPFHAGSDTVVLMLEAARRQHLYQPVLEALLSGQRLWADHSRPRLDMAETLAQQAGLNLVRAKADAQRPELQAVLKQDMEDLEALKVSKTPTFFVNGRSMPSFGETELRDLVAEAVAKARQAK